MLVVDGSTTDSEPGAGPGLQLGYGLTPHVALVAEGTLTRTFFGGDDAALMHLDLGLRYAFTGAARRLAPYIEAGLTRRGLGYREETYSGSGVSLGGGAHFYASPSAALGLGVRWMSGTLDAGAADGVPADAPGIPASSTRISMSVLWFPGSGR